MMAYVTAQDLADYLRSTVTADEAFFDAARLGAESTINDYCQRTFTVPTTATTRTFVPNDSRVVVVPDIANTTDLVIVDSGTTLSASSYQLEISPGVIGPIGVSGRTWPYTLIRHMTGSWKTDPWGDNTLSITARWGWAAVPPEVIEATKLLSRDFLLARDMAFGIMQTGDGFSRRIVGNGVVEALLGPLKRPEAWGIA
jgi:hypothetical protein